MTMKKQEGFTLIELAIVLVIVGLLLGGILKGRELIGSATVKSYAADFRNVPVYLYLYQDKFRALPGDDAAATSHIGCAAAEHGSCDDGDGDGTIEGAWDSDTPSDESLRFWQHVRIAGLVSGAVNPADPEFRPKNAEGGRLGVQSATVAGVVPAGLPGTLLMCSGGIPGRFVAQLDRMLDDGTSDRGAMRAYAGVSGGWAAPAALQAADSYNVCLSF